MENQAAKTEPVSETAGKTDTTAAGQDQQRPAEEINPFDYPGTERVRIRHLETKQMSQEDIDRVLQLTGQLEAFEILMMYYDCALAEVRTKLEVLNREVGLKKNRNPFESIKSRLKKPVSIYEKLKHRRIPFSVENIEIIPRRRGKIKPPRGCLSRGLVLRWTGTIRRSFSHARKDPAARAAL